MRAQKILKNCAIVFLIICVVILAIDLFKVLKINFNFAGMQSSDRISSSSKAEAVRYEPTNYKIANKDDALEEIKKIAGGLKEDYESSTKKENLFEIGNVHKIKNFFYNYQSYTVVKYKLLNIIEDLPKLYSSIKEYSDSQLTDYFNNNMTHIEKYYGITDSNEFVKLAKTLDFLGNGKVKEAIIDIETITFDYDNNVFTCYMYLDGEPYFVRADYYKSNDNQVKPYVKFIVN